MPSLDILSPSDVRTRRITLALARPFDRRLAFRPIELSVRLTGAALTAGIVLPLELTVTSATLANFYRHVFTRVAPTSVTFTPREGGEHLVRLREVTHNKWWGALVVVVEGDQS